jgi:hypothetical protein
MPGLEVNKLIRAFIVMLLCADKVVASCRTL